MSQPPAPPRPPPPPSKLRFTLQASAAHGTDTATNILASVTTSDVFTAHPNGYYCSLSPAVLHLDIPNSKLTEQHLDQVVVSITARQEATQESFMQVRFKVEDYRYPAKTASIHEKHSKKEQPTSNTAINRRLQLKYNNEVPTTTATQVPKGWRHGYVAFKLRGKNLAPPEKSSSSSSAMVPSIDHVKKLTSASFAQVRPGTVAEIDTDTTRLSLTFKHLGRTHVHKACVTRRTSIDDSQLQLAIDKKRLNIGRKNIWTLTAATCCFLILGIVWYPLVEEWTVLDSLYFSVVTLTTVGCKLVQSSMKCCSSSHPHVRAT